MSDITNRVCPNCNKGELVDCAMGVYCPKCNHHIAFESGVSMRLKSWVVKSNTEIDDETGKPLYWNNQLGWVDRRMATIFHVEQLNVDDAVNEELTDVETRVVVMDDIMACWEQLYELYSDYSDLTDEQIRDLRSAIEKRIDDALQWLNTACQITEDDVAKYTEE